MNEGHVLIATNDYHYLEMAGFAFAARDELPIQLSPKVETQYN